MNVKEIKEMINLMNENGLTELEIEKEGLRIRLKKGIAGEMSVEGLKEKVVFAPAPPVMERGSAPPASVATAEILAEKLANGKSRTDIKSPMVGTFYRSPSPESPAFVEINQAIEVGQVICIIEAMKLMNEIKSEIRGKIVDVLVNNAEPVEFGQPLFLIEPV
jgi:acetyl-CoA carboxylase biotin carboxyl carrier protein